jgi:flagellar biosynthesis protein FliR
VFVKKDMLETIKVIALRSITIILAINLLLSDHVKQNCPDGLTIRLLRSAFNSSMVAAVEMITDIIQKTNVNEPVLAPMEKSAVQMNITKNATPVRLIFNLKIYIIILTI